MSIARVYVYYACVVFDGVVPEEPFAVVSAPNSPALIAFLAIVAAGMGRHENVGEFSILTCESPCGERRDYRTWDEIPRHSAECKCGKLPVRHWFVRYDDEIAAENGRIGNLVGEFA